MGGVQVGVGFGGSSMFSFGPASIPGTCVVEKSVGRKRVTSMEYATTLHRSLKLLEAKLNGQPKQPQAKWAHLLDDAKGESPLPQGVVDLVMPQLPKAGTAQPTPAVQDTRKLVDLYRMYYANKQCYRLVPEPDIPLCQTSGWVLCSNSPVGSVYAVDRNSSSPHSSAMSLSKQDTIPTQMFGGKDCTYYRLSTSMVERPGEHRPMGQGVAWYMPKTTKRGQSLWFASTNPAPLDEKSKAFVLKTLQTPNVASQELAHLDGTLCFPSTYTFDVDQVDALVPLYRWLYKDSNCIDLLSVHDVMHAQCGYRRESPHPVGYVYKRQVRDSKPCHRYKSHWGWSHTTNAMNGACEGIAWWQPTKGPFSFVRSDEHASNDYGGTNLFV